MTTDRKQMRWYNVVQRLIQEARKILSSNSSDGVVRVTMELYMNHDGEPLFWIITNTSRIEPSSDAKSLVSMYVDGAVD